MGKILLRSLIFILITFFFAIAYLGFFGIETDKFDKIIKKKSNEVNQYVKLEFNKTKIHLNIRELNLAVRLQDPKVIIKDDTIILSKLDLFLPIRSFFTSDFLLKRSEIAFNKNDIKDITKITSIFIPKIVNKQLKKIFAKGVLEGELIIPFDTDGNIGKNYGFSGKISNALINLTKKFSIKNLTTEISNTKKIGSNEFELMIKSGSIYDINLSDSNINVKLEKDKINIKSLLETKGKLDFSQIKKISNLFGLEVKKFENINGTVDLSTNINFDLNKKLRIKNLFYEITGDIEDFEIHTKEKKIIEEYLPEYDPKIVLKNTNIKFANLESGHNLELDGQIKIKDSFDNFKIKEFYKNKVYDIRGVIDLTNSKFKVSRLNYNKEAGIESELSFQVNFVPNKYYNVKNLKFIAKKSKIFLSNIKLNNQFEIIDFKKLEIKTFLNKIKNNDFFVKKDKNVLISGEVFDAEHLLKTLYKKNEKKMFSKGFNSEIKINFNKTLTGTDDDILDFAMIASIRKGSYNKLNLKGNFSENEIIEMSIYQVDQNKKTLQVISDRARPFVKNFDFIKGFEGGKLEYESIISKEDSSSNLIITDFKVSKVPALAKLLTLASLQGIADTLSGEGIRFDSFEMKSNSKGNVLNIEDALAMGPAVSILLSGYVDKGKVISLRGTLVPATKLNSIIASIPVVGDILVGKKTGEGVIGVSFKMKGPPKDIKTTVNPIKTLTPRFIVRAVEKMKNKKKEKAN